MIDKKILLSRYGRLTINEAGKTISWQDKANNKIVFDYLLYKDGDFKHFLTACIDWLLDRYVYLSK